MSQLSRIFITHMHGDHIFGLMGLLATCGLAGNVERIDIYGPPGLNDYIQSASRYSYTHFSYPIKVHAIRPGIIYEDEDFTVSCGNLHHRITAFGYRVAEKDRTGRFDVEKAKALQIPPGRVYGQLKRGETVTLADGRVIDGTQLCGPTEIGRKIAYCTDTIYCDGAVQLAHDADVLIHEATFAHQDADMAFQRLHSTTTMAAQTALAAGARRLIMSHFSPRYAPGNTLELKDLLKEARAIFPRTDMAYDFMIHEVPRRREIELTKVGV